MQQRQLRLGDILDDYCPRERRVTNHAVVAMVGADVKQTRCTTCDSEHEYKEARVPRQRRKSETPAALYAHVASAAPKAPALHEPATPSFDETIDEPAAPGPDAADAFPPDAAPLAAEAEPEPEDEGDGEGNRDNDRDEGPVHRPLIRASLPRPEGQAPAARPLPEFTIRQPGGRPNRFRPRHPRGAGAGGGGGHMFHGNRSNGNPAGGPPRGLPRHGNRPVAGRHGGGRKRSK